MEPRRVGEDLFSEESEYITDAETGGTKGQKSCRFDLIPVAPLAEIAVVYGKGLAKYGARNWELGYVWSNSYAALLRHVNRFWAGERTDPESGLHPLAHAAFHLLALMEFENTHPDKDDRPAAK